MVVVLVVGQHLEVVLQQHLPLDLQQMLLLLVLWQLLRLDLVLSQILHQLSDLVEVVCLVEAVVPQVLLQQVNSSVHGDKMYHLC